MRTKARANSHSHRTLWVLLSSGLIFRSVIAYFLPIGFDEAYYFLYSQHLDWSYFDHPPAVAWSVGAGLWLTGLVTPFTLRLGALGLFTGCLWLLYATARQLFGHRTGLLSCAIASLCPLFFLSFGTLAAPDNALMFFWGLTLFLCSQEFFPTNQQPCYRPSSNLIWISLAVGLACLGKYHGFVLGIGLVGFCAANSKYRSALISKWLWLGVVVFAITIFPIFYWNAQHDWISFRFQLGDRFAEYDPEPSSYSLGALLGVIGAQIGYLFPSIAFPLWWITLKTFFSQTLQRFTHKKASIDEASIDEASIDEASIDKKRRLYSEKISFILWSGLPIALAFTLIGGATHTFPAWPAPGLWSLTILLGVAAADWPRKNVKHWLQITAWTIGIFILFALTHLTLGTLQKPSDYALFGGIVAAQDDPSTQLIDVVQLRKLFSDSVEFQDAIAQSDLIITREYWLSGYFAMAMPKSVPLATSLPVTSFTIDPRGHAFWFDPSDWIGKNALLISLADISQNEFLSEMTPYFETITPLTEIATKRGGEDSEIFYLYQAESLLKPYPYPY
ncbi:MAG: glycosyltransferase family 39 protein [Cyanobacteria bacterium J06650_10]